MHTSFLLLNLFCLYILTCNSDFYIKFTAVCTLLEWSPESNLSTCTQGKKKKKKNTSPLIVLSIVMFNVLRCYICDTWMVQPPTFSFSSMGGRVALRDEAVFSHLND